MAEKILDEGFVATAKDKLRTTIVALDILDEYLDAAAWHVALALDLLALRQDASCLAQLDPHNAWLNSLDNTRHNRTNLVLKLCQHHFALSLAQALQYHLLGSLSCHTTKARHIVRLLNGTAQLGIGVCRPCFF